MDALNDLYRLRRSRSSGDRSARLNSCLAASELFGGKPRQVFERDPAIHPRVLHDHVNKIGFRFSARARDRLRK
jgi:hypothetical protein